MAATWLSKTPKQSKGVGSIWTENLGLKINKRLPKLKKPGDSHTMPEGHSSLTCSQLRRLMRCKFGQLATTRTSMHAQYSKALCR